MIGVITTSYPRHPGDAAGSFVAAHVAWLRRQGYAVEVVAAADARAAGGSRHELDSGVVRVPSPGSLFYCGGAPDQLERLSPQLVTSALGFCRNLAREVGRRARRWEAVIAHWLVPSGVVAAAAGRGRRPVLCIAHSGDVHLLARTGATTAAAALLCLARADLVFVSDALRRRFLAATLAPVRPAVARRARVCSMGIDRAHWGRLRRAWAPAAAPATVLFLGRLVPIKGVATLLGAAAQWATPARLLIGGDGPEARALRLEAQRRKLARIEFLGPLDAAGRDRALAAADLLVLPSHVGSDGRGEGCPVVVLEAMAAGVPVVVSDSGGLADLPAAAVTRVPWGDAAALAGAVDRLLADPCLRQRRADRARRFVADRDWSVVGPLLLPRALAQSTGRGCPDEAHRGEELSD